jgi:hypothetical protein
MPVLAASHRSHHSHRPRDQRHSLAHRPSSSNRHRLPCTVLTPRHSGTRGLLLFSQPRSTILSRACVCRGVLMKDLASPPVINQHYFAPVLDPHQAKWNRGPGILFAYDRRTYRQDKSNCPSEGISHRHRRRHARVLCRSPSHLSLFLIIVLNRNKKHSRFKIQQNSPDAYTALKSRESFAQRFGPRHRRWQTRVRLRRQEEEG